MKDSIIGHEWAVDLLLHGLAGGRVSHATLIVGPPNIGKTTLARWFAQAVRRVYLVPQAEQRQPSRRANFGRAGPDAKNQRSARVAARPVAGALRRALARGAAVRL